MNTKTFLALLRRDARVARRNFIPLILQTLLQPMLLVFIFGRVMTTSGYMPLQYKSLLLPGIMALSMVLSGIQAVAMPLISEFQFSREIEDRLLAPIEIQWVAVEKVFSGCTDYRWSALARFAVLQRVVLVNPVVYARDGLRSALVPQFPHISVPAVLGALAIFDGIFQAAGLRQFRKKAIH